jgi:hypothetical protein
VVIFTLEGLMALRREDLGQQVGLTYDQQVGIAEAATKAWDEQANILHRRLFTLTQVRDIPAIQVRLREISAELDRTILKLLPDDAKKKLVPLVIESRKWNDLIRRPGGF